MHELDTHRGNADDPGGAIDSAGPTGPADPAGPSSAADTDPAANPAAPESGPSFAAEPPRKQRRTQRGASRRRPWLLICAVILLGLIAATAIGTSIYLYRTTEAWRVNSQQLDDRVRDLADEKATISDELRELDKALDRTETQLDNARDRITALADEKAQLGDEHAVSQRLVEYQEHVAEITADVLFVLDECIAGQERVMGYLADADNYDPDDLTRLQSEVQDYCQDATDAATTLNNELSQ